MTTVNVTENRYTITTSKGDTAIVPQQTVAVVTAGTQGPQGPAGPNNVTGSTTTNLTGYLKGNGSAVSAQATPIPVADGGTGTATPALVAGSNVTITGTWPNQTIAATGGSPGGSTGQVQFNSGGSFGADTGLTWDNTNKRLGVGTASPAGKLHAQLKGDNFSWESLAYFGVSKIDGTNAASLSLEAYYDQAANRILRFMPTNTTSVQWENAGQFVFNGQPTFNNGIIGSYHAYFDITSNYNSLGGVKGVRLQCLQASNTNVFFAGENNRCGVNTLSPAGSLHIQSQSATDRVLIAQGASAQTANLQEWQDSAGTIQLAIQSTGYIYAPSEVRFANPDFFPEYTSIDSRSGTTIRNNKSGGTMAFDVNGAGTFAFSRSGTWKIVYDGSLGLASDVAIKFSSNVNGNGTPHAGISAASGVVSITNGSTGNGALICGAPTAATVALTVKAAASQTANLQEWRDSSNNLLVSVASTVGTGGSLRISRASDASRYGEITYGIGGQGLRITDSGIYLENNNGNWFSTGQWGSAGGFTVNNVSVALSMTDGAGQSAGIGRTLFDGGGIVRLYANSSGTGNGALRCGAPSASTVGLAVQGAASQTADLTQWQNSAGTALLSVGAPTGAEPVIWLRGQGTNSLGFRSNGIVQLGSGGLTTFNQFINLDDNGFYRGNFNLTLSDGNNQLLLQSGHTAFSSGRAAIVLNNSATVSTSDLLSVRNNGTAALIVGPGGNGYALNIPILNASDRGIVVKGAASQTGNLTEWQNSAGTAGAVVDSARNFSRPNGTNAEQFGKNASAAGTNGLAVGNGATATGTSAIAIGTSCSVTETGGSGSIAIGVGTTTNGSGIVAIGNGQSVTASNAAVVGSGNVLSSGATIGIGAGNALSNFQARALGQGNTVSHISVTALGSGLTSVRRDELIVGADTTPGGTAGYTGGYRVRIASAASDSNAYSSGLLDTSWITATAGSQVSRVTLSAYNVSTAQEAIRIDAASDQARVAIGGSVASGTRSIIYTGVATDIGLAVRGAASQSANLQEWQNSAGTLLGYVNASGVVGVTEIAALNSNMNVLLNASNTGISSAGLGPQLFLGFNSRVSTSPASQFSWSSTSQSASGTPDTGLARNAAGVVKVTNGTSGNGAFICGSPTASTVALAVQGAASQTANIQEWQNSAGTVLTSVSSAGRIGIGTASPGVPLHIVADGGGNGFTVVGTGGSLLFQQGGVQSSMLVNSSTVPFLIGTGGGSTLAGSELQLVTSATTRLSIDANGTVSVGGFTAANKGLIVKGAASQTASLQEWQDSSGTLLANVSSLGGAQFRNVITTLSDAAVLTFAGGANFQRSSSTGEVSFVTQNFSGAGFLVNNSSGNAGTVVLKVRAAASQTANLFEAQNSSGTVLASIGAGGALSLPITSVSANTTLDASHYTVLVDATAASRTITLPAAASTSGRIYNIKKTDSSANTVTIDANASETIDGALTQVLTVQFESITIQCNGSNWFIV